MRSIFIAACLGLLLTAVPRGPSFTPRPAGLTKNTGALIPSMPSR